MKKSIAIVCIVALALGVFLIGEPLFQLSAFGVDMSIGYEQIDEGVITIVRICSVAAIACMAAGLFTSQKLWSIPAVAVGVYCLFCVVSLLMDTDKVLRNEYVDFAMELLNGECNATGVLWLFIATETLAVICGVGMLLASEQEFEMPSFEIFTDFFEDIGNRIADILCVFPRWLNSLKEIEPPKPEVYGYLIGDLCGLGVGILVAVFFIQGALNPIVSAVLIIAAAGVVAGGINYFVWQKIGGRV